MGPEVSLLRSEGTGCSWSFPQAPGRLSGSVCLALCLLVCACCVAQEDGFDAAVRKAERLSHTPDTEAAVAAYEAAIAAAPRDADKARALYGLAMLLQNRQLFTRAITALEELVAIEPPTMLHLSALQLLAMLCQSQGRLDRALRAYEQAERLAEADERSVQEALNGQIRTLQQMGDLQRAAEVAGRLVKRFPESPYASIAVAVLVEAAVERGDLAEARRLAEAEAMRKGSDPSILLRVAALLQEHGMLREAVELVERFLEARPDNPGALQMLYELHAKAGTLPVYEKQLIEARGKSKDKPAALRRLADFYVRREEPEKALEVLDGLVKLLPRNAEVLAEAGRMAMAASQGERAVAYYRRAVDVEPDNARLQLELGDLLAEQGNTEEALAAWKSGTAYVPGDETAARRLGQHLLSRGLYQEAVDIYLQARAASDDATALASELGEAYEAMLLIEEAVSEYVRAMSRKGGGSRGAQRRLERLAMDEAARPDVVAALEKLTADAAAPDGAHLALALAYLRGGDTTRAREAFERIGDAGERGIALAETAQELEDGGKTRAARELYQMALQSRLPPGLQAQISQRLAAIEQERGNWRGAVHWLSAALEVPNQQEAAEGLMLSLADVLVLQAGDYEQAAALYGQVATRTRDAEARSRAAWGLADCVFVAGRHDEAIAAYSALGGQQALEDAPPLSPFNDGPMGWVSPDRAPRGDGPRPMGAAYAAYQIAESRFRKGEFEGARTAFESVAHDFQGSAQANDALGRVLLIATEFTGESPAEGKYVEALAQVDRAEIEKAIKTLDLIASTGEGEPLADDAALLKADAVARFGDPDEAVRLYLALVQAEPGSPLTPLALLRAGDVKARDEAGREQALEIYRSLLAGFPGSPEAQEASLAIEAVTRQ